MVICDRQRVKIFAGLRFGMIFYIYWQGFNIFFRLELEVPGIHRVIGRMGMVLL